MYLFAPKQKIGPYVRWWSHCLQSLHTSTGFCDFTPTSQLIEERYDLRRDIIKKKLKLFAIFFFTP